MASNKYYNNTQLTKLHNMEIEGINVWKFVQVCTELLPVFVNAGSD